MGLFRKAFTELRDGYRQEQKFTGKRPHPPEPDEKQPGPKRHYSIKAAAKDAPAQAYGWVKTYGASAGKSIKAAGRSKLR